MLRLGICRRLCYGDGHFFSPITEMSMSKTTQTLRNCIFARVLKDITLNVTILLIPGPEVSTSLC